MFVVEDGCISRLSIVYGSLKRVKIQMDSYYFRGPVKKKKAPSLDLVNNSIAFALLGAGRWPNYAAVILGGEGLPLLSGTWIKRLGLTVRRRNKKLKTVFAFSIFLGF